jgi:hypothetical protein
MTSKNLPEKWKSPADVAGTGLREWRRRAFQEENVRRLKGHAPENNTTHVLSARPTQKLDEKAALAEESGISPTGAQSSCAPAERSILEHEYFLRLSQEDFPLENFDSLAFEHFHDSPGDENDWITMCASGRSPVMVPGAKGEHRWRWERCTVLRFDQASRRFVVRFSADKGSAIEKRVKRLNLVFDCEDEHLFRARVARARAKRDAAMARARFEHFLAKQPVRAVAGRRRARNFFPRDLFAPFRQPQTIHARFQPCR